MDSRLDPWALKTICLTCETNLRSEERHCKRYPKPINIIKLQTVGPSKHQGMGGNFDFTLCAASFPYRYSLERLTAFQYPA
jgi:hypothetical protein